MALAKEIDNDSIDARIRTHRAGILIQLKRFDEAEKLLVHNVESPDIAPSTLGMTYNNLGSVFVGKEAFEQATVNFLKAAKIFEPMNDSTMLSKTFANLGVIHARLKNYKKAIAYLNRGLEFTGNDELLKMQLNLNLAGLYNEEKQVEKAIATALITEKLAKKFKANSVLAILYTNLCNSYLEQGELDTSIAYGLQALQLKQSLSQGNSIVLNNLGYAYLQKGDHAKALHYLKRALPSARGEAKSLIYKNLSKTTQNMGNYREAVRFANLHIELKDSLNLLEQQKNVSELIEKFESEKKQQQLDLLNTKNELSQNQITNQRNFIWGIALLSILIILIGFLWYRNQKTNQSLNAAKIQHRLLQTQLNPHFIFNALNSMQSFGYANNKEQLSDYIDSFGKLMRSILESSDRDFITVAADAQALKEYLYLQKVSMADAFETKVRVEPELDAQQLLPPMFTQPFVENSVVHGLKNKTGGLVEVVYSEVNGQLCVAIKDNGGGVQKNSSPANKLHRSMGMNIIKDRVANLKKTHDYQCSIEINSNDSGTVVRLTFPIRHKKLS